MKGCINICTAISYTTKDHYFGRNLDLDHSYHEAVVIVPRKYPFSFCNSTSQTQHYAIIGIATIADGYPLFYDAANEHGLSVAALNFPGNARYFSKRSSKDNIAPYELIPWILCQCKNTDQAETLLSNINISDIAFNESYPLTPLHWIVSDKKRSITVETVNEGLQIYENPVGVLTNNPPFPFHLHNLTNYLNLTREIPQNRFSDQITLAPYSLGMGALGLPGDLSSASRFVRAAFTKLNSVCGHEEAESVSQFFHILQSVAQTNGCCRTENGFEKTVYTSCCNTDRGIYYYTTYENSQISAVSLHCHDLDTSTMYHFPLIRQLNILNIE